MVPPVMASGCVKSCRFVLPEDRDPKNGGSVLRPRHNGDILDGYSEIVTQARSGPDIRLYFEGMARTWRAEDVPDQCGRQIHKQQHQFLSQTEHISCRELEGSLSSLGHLVYRIRFQFLLPQNSITLDSNTSEAFLRLPPSLNYGKPYSIWTDSTVYMHPSIVYRSRATIKTAQSGRWKGNQQDFYREIPIIPIQEPDPPVEVGDFPGEYRTSSTKRLKRRFWKGPTGISTVASVEPGPSRINHLNAEPSTKIMLKFAFKPFCSNISEFPFLGWEFAIRSTLIAKTFFQTDPGAKARPAFETVRDSPLVTQKTVSYLDQRQRSRSSVWISEEGHCDKSTLDPEPAWTATVESHFNASHHLIPTFASPLAVRRYVMKLKVRVVGMRHSPLVSRLPLQVTYELAEMVAAKDSRLADEARETDSLGNEILWEGLGVEDMRSESTLPPPYER